MSLDVKMQNIEKEILIGIKFKSADRLRNLINEYPNNLEIWERLAELYYEGGFLDAAGRYWILTEPNEDRIKKCVQLYEKSVNYSGAQILNEITFRGDKNELSEFARKKLIALEKDSKRKMNYVPSFSSKVNKAQRKSNQTQQSFNDRIVMYALISLLMLIPILSILGFIEIISWIF